ncbi:hypothetical protein SI65_02820 [Aspergillus cristatus]|uniref:Uncharacterized protein n=1 Tax=Aspergillus cristatus TaxID=573508 RepID=A0A1E3BNN1_ASPCR|nr:hypothetical protein SI65_02820 [Aspergillus cristatus]
MSSTNHIVRNRLDFLHNQLVNPDKAPLADDGHHINNPSELNILHISQYDLEHWDVDTNPELLFEPMSLTEIQKYPINPDEMDEDQDWATGSARDDSDLLEIRGLQEVRIPNLFLLNYTLCGYYPDASLRLSRELILETERDHSQDAHPLVVMTGYQPCNGKEDRILYGELVLVFCAMQNRAKQPKAKYEEEAEELSNMPEKLRLRYHDERRFPDEVHFPVLLLSFVVSQHGRMLYPCMDVERMVIRQSRLYSFEREESALLDLFARFLLSLPGA